VSPSITPTESSVAHADKRPDARDWRRYWAGVLPRQQTFANRRARELAEWADAIRSEEGWEAWVAIHPGGVPAELRR
jgi:hypothetical protein